MELRSDRPEGLREMAHRIRERANACEPGYYRDLIFQSAVDLDQLADALAQGERSELFLFDDDKQVRPPKDSV